jgi:hypothetical protein
MVPFRFRSAGGPVPFRLSLGGGPGALPPFTRRGARCPSAFHSAGGPVPFRLMPVIEQPFSKTLPPPFWRGHRDQGFHLGPQLRGRGVET